MNENIEPIEDILNNIINKKFLRFTDYFNQLTKKEKHFLSTNIISGYIPNLHIYNNLIEPVDFTDYISDILYKNHIYNILNKNTIGRRYRNNIGKSKLCICTFPENLFSKPLIPIGHINDINNINDKNNINDLDFSDLSDLSDSSESLDIDAEILYIDLDDDDIIEFNVNIK
jgi:hypothetical protein